MEIISSPRDYLFSNYNYKPSSLRSIDVSECKSRRSSFEIEDNERDIAMNCFEFPPFEGPNELENILINFSGENQVAAELVSNQIVNP